MRDPSLIFTAIAATASTIAALPILARAVRSVWYYLWSKVRAWQDRATRYCQRCSHSSNAHRLHMELDVGTPNTLRCEDCGCLVGPSGTYSPERVYLRLDRHATYSRRTVEGLRWWAKWKLKR